MSASFRPKRSIPSAVNTPTAAHIKSSQSLNKEETENILSEFISVSEAIAGTLPNALDSSQVAFSNTGLSNSTGNSAILSQLKRVQRDLRGLPPMLSEVIASNEGATATTEGQNKKIKFDDDGDVSLEPKNKKIKFDEAEEEGVADASSEDEEDVVEDDEEEENDEPKKEHKGSKVKKEKHEKKDKKHKKEKKDKKDKTNKKSKNKESK